MRSTGEVLGLASTFGEAFFKAQEATQTCLPTEGVVLMSVSNRNKDDLEEVARAFIDAGFSLMATDGTHNALTEAGIQSEKVFKAHEGRPNLIDHITNGTIAFVLNTPSSSTESMEDDSYIRKAAIKAHIPYVTTMAGGLATALGVKAVKEAADAEVKSLQEIHDAIQ